MEFKGENPIVKGFAANGVHAGIKEERKNDLALIFSETPAQAAGVFTSNLFKAAPVILDMERIRKGVAQAILANSGNANAANGRNGYLDACAMAKTASSALKIREDLVLVASTGIIGKRIPLGKIRSSMGKLVGGLRPTGLPAAEEGIMTTDRFPKMAYRKVAIGNKCITLCGLAKGAGMIEPNMATMLSFILTDAALDHETLRVSLKRGVDRSFNTISVDGCMSTNDTVIALANGKADNRPITGRSRERARFDEALVSLMKELALAIVKDGEGATKIMDITVSGANSRADAKKVAFSIARSNLVKTAFFGKDPNWGRVISAIGASGASLRTDEVELYFDDLALFRRGSGLKQNHRILSDIMEKGRIEIRVKLGTGPGTFTAHASDLGYGYVKINAQYHT